MKICKRCQIEKPFDEYYPSKVSKDKLAYHCKSCEKEKVKARNSRPEAKLKAKARMKKWNNENKDKRKEYLKKNKLRINTRRRNRYLCNELHREMVKQRAKNYRNNPLNAEKQRIARRKSLNKRKKDPKFRMIMNIRRRFLHVLNGNRKADYTMNMIGCSREYLLQYLESKFQPGMTWQNYGKKKDSWCVDHIIPCSHFDLENHEEQRECFHYTNLQPKWFLENASKGDRYIG